MYALLGLEHLPMLVAIFLIIVFLILLVVLEMNRTSKNGTILLIVEAFLGYLISLLVVTVQKKFDLNKLDNIDDIITFLLFLILLPLILYITNSYKNLQKVQQQIVYNEDIKKMIGNLNTLSSSLKQTLTSLQTNVEDIEQNVKNLRYSENWHEKVRTSISNKVIWKHIATKYFDIQRGYLENENKIITSLDYYPSITKQLFEKYLRQKTAKFEIVSTMLPQHYFNFPMYKICDEKTKKIIQKCKKVEFVDIYRKDIATLVRQIDNSKSHMTFNRYTLLLDSESEVGFHGLFSVNEFNKSKDVFLERNSNKLDDFIDDNNIYRENSKQKKSTDITPYSYFIDELHSNNAIIKLLQEKEISERLENFNFLRIEHKVNNKISTIYIVAEISISKHLVSLEIIDNLYPKRFQELEEDYAYIKTRKNYNL